MDFSKYTIKAQEAIQRAQQIALGSDHQAIDNGHLLQGLLETDTSVLPYVFRKLSVNENAIRSALERIIEGYPNVSGGNVYLSESAKRSLAKAENVMKSMDDEYLTVEHLFMGVAQSSDSVGQLLKDSGINQKDLKAAIDELRKGAKATSSSAFRSSL